MIISWIYSRNGTGKCILFSESIFSLSIIKDINTINDFEIKVFSDNVVITQKTNNEILCDQIISIVNLIALIQFEAFFEFGFSLRGGITIGELFIDDSIVWGTGLINAYQMENTLANYPRVLVSKNVIDAYQNSDKKSINLHALLKEDFDGAKFVNFFLAVPNLELIPDISASLQEQVLSRAKEEFRVRQKMNWIIFQFNQMCDEFSDRGNYAQYKIQYI